MTDGIKEINEVADELRKVADKGKKNAELLSILKSKSVDIRLVRNIEECSGGGASKYNENPFLEKLTDEEYKKVRDWLYE